MRKIVLVLVLPVLFAVLWCVAWFAAAGYAERQVADFIAGEATQGRTWTCPDRRIEGFPVALSVTCKNPTYAGEAMGQSIRAQTAGLVASVSLAHPRQVAISLAPPFAYESSDGRTKVGGTWDSLEFDLSSLPEPLTLALDASNVSVHGRFPGQEDTGGAAKSLTARFTRSPAAEPPTVDFAVAMRGAPVPVVDALVGGSAPIDASVSGRLDKADPGEARTPEEAMERWRQAGGTVALSEVQVSRETASATATGKLGLDELHRPRGRLDATFFGLGPILKRYGISPDTAAIGALIGNLFGGGRPTKPAAPGALSLPVGLGNGRLSIGPIATDVALTPLY